MFVKRNPIPIFPAPPNRSKTEWVLVVIVAAILLFAEPIIMWLAK